MFNLTYEEIISRIKEEKNISEDEIKQMIKQKLVQLSDLISKEGAAHIVANELGVNILHVYKELKINRLLSGMNNVTILGKVVKVNDIVQFNKNGRGGKVASILLGDETGMVRAVFWDSNHIKEIEDKRILEGILLKIKNGYVRSNAGYKEIHLGNRGELEIILDGMSIVVKDEIVYDFERKKINELKAGDSNVGIIGTIVQVFDPRFYGACSKCGKKLEIINENMQCKEHGNVAEELVPVINVFVDDGTDNIRAVAFRNHVESLLGVKKDELLMIRENGEEFDKIRDNVLGKQMLLIGRINKNEYFDRNELMVQRVKEVEPEELINELEKNI